MKQLGYVVRYLIKGRGSSLIKIISLTLGLVVGLVLYSQIAFEMSYENFFPGREQIYRLRRVCLSEEGKETSSGSIIYAPMPKAMMSDINGVENATLTTSSIEKITYQLEDKKYEEKTLNVDEQFLNLFQLKILSGDAQKMALPNQVFLSHSMAERLFGGRDPVGELMLFIQYEYKEIPITVAGVFEDLPENTEFDFEVLMSIQTLFANWGRQPGWLENDAYTGYVRLQPEMKPEEVEARIPAMLNNYYDVKAYQAKGRYFEYYLDPITSIHKSNPDVKKLSLILGILAFSLLFVSAMNYVLISISSLVKRSRLIGVYKTCGASDGNIFTQFMLETVVLVFVSLLFSVFIIFLFRGTIEELIRMPVTMIFSAHNLWVTASIVVFLLLIAGVIPAQIFSAIPASQAFKAGSVNKRYWKNILLFVQFVSVSCICGFLFIIVRQYDMMVNKDWGYSIDNVLYVRLNGVPADRLNLIKTEFRRIPSVTDVSMSTNIPLYGLTGDAVSDPETKKSLFLYKLIGADKDFLQTLRITLLSGKNFEADGEDKQSVLVNETFVKRMQALNFPLDHPFLNIDGEKRIVGVVKDFQLFNLYTETIPVIICSVDPVKGIWWGNTSFLIVKTEKITSGLMAELNRKLFSLTQNDNLSFKSYKESWIQEYASARLFRNSVIIASVIMLLITMLGLMGYIEDEIIRRSKEIAIRKINGASSVNIIYVITKDFGLVVVPAMMIGILLSYVFGADWLQQFVVKSSLNISLLAMANLLLLLFLLIGIGLRSWNVANENPILSVQSE